MDTKKKLYLEYYTYETIEDSYEDGEVPKTGAINIERVNKTFDTLPQLFKYLEETCFIPDGDWYCLDNNILKTYLVDEDCIKADERDIKLWKSKKKKLYSATVFLEIKVIVEYPFDPTEWGMEID